MGRGEHSISQSTTRSGLHVFSRKLQVTYPCLQGRHKGRWSARSGVQGESVPNPPRTLRVTQETAPRRIPSSVAPYLLLVHDHAWPLATSHQTKLASFKSSFRFCPPITHLHRINFTSTSPLFHIAFHKWKSQIYLCYSNLFTFNNTIMLRQNIPKFYDTGTVCIGQERFCALYP